VQIDILLLENDEEYVRAIRAHFSSINDGYHLAIWHARDILAALAICKERDVRVAIIDVLLEDGKTGTEAISKIWQFDKKIIFVIHTISPPQALMDWSTSIGVPYTSQFFLQKSGRDDRAYAEDSARLHNLAIKALRCYVPHIPSPLVSVREIIQTFDTFLESNPAFRGTSIIGSIHHSQDLVNAASQWAADRLSRRGFDSMRLAVVITGSFARLEATDASDADYFVVFDDQESKRVGDMMEIAYDAFLEVGNWFERNGVPVHEFRSEDRSPGKISWHTTVLPTWFPLRSFLHAKLGRTTQFELTKQWFLFESLPIFNADLVNVIREKVCMGLGIFPQSTVRDAITHSTLIDSFHMLRQEFELSFKIWPRNSLSTIKYYFMRLINLFSIRLWILRCFLDPLIFDAPPEMLFRELAPHPLARIIQFHSFLNKNHILSDRSLKRCLEKLEALCNLYAEAASAFGSKFLREGKGSRNETLTNNLMDSGRDCQQHMEDILSILKKARSISSHPEIHGRQII